MSDIEGQTPPPADQIPAPTPRPGFYALQRVPVSIGDDLCNVQCFTEHGNFTFFLRAEDAISIGDQLADMGRQIENGIKVVRGSTNHHLRDVLEPMTRRRH